MKDWAAEEEENERDWEGTFQILLNTEAETGVTWALIAGGGGSVLLIGTTAASQPQGPTRILLSIPGLVGGKLRPSPFAMVAISQFCKSHEYPNLRHREIATQSKRANK